MPNQLVVFTLDEQQYALHLSAVQRIVRMVEVTPLPKAPEIIKGVIDMHGTIIPVLDMRKRFGLPQVETKLGQQLIIARTSARTVALATDAVSGMVERSQEHITHPEKIAPGIQYVEGVANMDGHILLIHDLDQFLCL